jgi:hypothetical protein
LPGKRLPGPFANRRLCGLVIERKAADEELSEAEVLALRQREALPILESLGKWMKQAYIEVLPKIAIGRKNYLFAGSHEAAQRSAMLYSLLGTCKLQGVNPFIRLKNVLEVIPSHPINKIQELLPCVKIKSSDKRSYLNVFINVVGTISILALLYYKVNEFLLSWMITPN